jgi:hypothetical protein
MILLPQNDRDRRYDRQILFLNWLSWGLGWMILGVIIGHILI